MIQKPGVHIYALLVIVDKIIVFPRHLHIEGIHHFPCEKQTKKRLPIEQSPLFELSKNT